jgi:hypothetical protein
MGQQTCTSDKKRKGEKTVTGNEKTQKQERRKNCRSRKGEKNRNSK